MRKFLRIVGLLIILCGAIFLAKELTAQVPPKTPTEAAPQNPEVVALIAKEFGEEYKLVAEIPPMYGDFDSDGKQDLAVVATGKNPLMGEGSHNYKTLDPYNDSFGYGNPKVTMAFNTENAKARFILIIHSWQAPKQKFVLVNVPFEKIRLGHMMKKKKPVDALEATDETGIQAAIYFNGKKYRWEIIGSEVDR